MPNKTSLNFNCGSIDGIDVDAGGYTYYYLKNNPTVPIRYFNQFQLDTHMPCDMCSLNADEQATFSCCNYERLKQMGFDNNQIKFIESGPLTSEFMENGTFLHYRAGTNWDQKSSNFHNRKTALLNKYMEHVLSEDSTDNRVQIINE